MHVLDLKPSEEQLFKSLHKDSIQRKIRRAEREKLAYESGRSEQLQDEFYELLLLTRRRHQLPPQPRVWFRNLAQCMDDRLVIRVARKNGAPIAALLSLRHGSTVVYKYGSSDEKFHNLGGMPMLFWRLIQESKATGAETLDFGRSDLDNEGLIVFKDKWGTARTTLTYLRYPDPMEDTGLSHLGAGTIRRCFSLLPDALLSAAGRVLYRHMG
jgi:lipid II:glycine glycyltransferase (peptidoglycan interpeptide bridge formation enzyme)